MILIWVTEDSMGNIILQPKSEKVREQMRKHTWEMTGSPYDTVLLQAEAATQEFLERLTPRQRDGLNYNLVIKMDAWEFGHYVGHDFHEVVRP